MTAFGCLHNPNDGSIAHRRKCHVRVLESHGGHGHQQYRHVDYLFGDKTECGSAGGLKGGLKDRGLRHKSSVRCARTPPASLTSHGTTGRMSNLKGVSSLENAAVSCSAVQHDGCAHRAASI